MPKREDEYWAGMKEPKGRGLCPFCGSSDIYYNKRYESWRCTKCEKSFPMPSYGPGGDFGKEARWFGKTTEEIRQREFAEVAREARARKGEHPRRSGKSGRLPGWLMPAVVIVLLVMFGTAVWALWGSDITDFFSTTSTSPPTEVSELPPEEATTPPDTSSGSVIIPSRGDGVSVFDSKQPPYSKTFGIPINLINNDSATDPTWQQLVLFLFADTIDEKSYSVFSFPCGAFAEGVHNNAEAAGIRAAWVSVDFEDDSEGHALNAFNTIDKGLVYVDCTGDDPRFAIPGRLVYDPTTGEIEWEYPPEPDHDKVAYVVVGREYGLISVEVAISPEYSFYESYLAKREEYEIALETYNQEVETYNQALGGRTVLEEPDYSRFMEWLGGLNAKLAELEVLSEELGDFYWQSLGVVANIEIYW